MKFSTALFIVPVLVIVALMLPSRSEAAGNEIECPQIVPIEQMLNIMLVNGRCVNNAYNYALVSIPTSQLGNIYLTERSTTEGIKRFLGFQMDTGELSSEPWAQGAYFGVFLTPAEHDPGMREELARELFNPSSGTVVALVWNSQKWVNSGGRTSIHVEALPLYITR